MLAGGTALFTGGERGFGALNVVRVGNRDDYTRDESQSAAEMGSGRSWAAKAVPGHLARPWGLGPLARGMAAGDPVIGGMDIAVGPLSRARVPADDQLRRQSHQAPSCASDEGRITILVLVVASALASLLAILAELGGANRPARHLALAAITILLSWAFTHTIFAIHYAHEYYSERAHKGGGLNFLPRRRASRLLGLCLFFLRVA